MAQQHGPTRPGTPWSEIPVIRQALEQTEEWEGEAGGMSLGEAETVAHVRELARRLGWRRPLIELVEILREFV